ncbi:hypothetical protein CYMTET_34722 [Cymbomonas tetramitiformis]|uniref:Helicase ATP-binding domain-containing protein n=1 Tax=Cymbomonas tetramitiformis TaxID=36881 RepID=A0AAE0KPL0_9CHLO|nr:hypothetical protein CYMTET_34722 [Cymbomonas tetramitiformis]
MSGEAPAAEIGHGKVTDFQLLEESGEETLDQIRELTLRERGLTSLGDNISQLTSLEVLSLSHNRFSNLDGFSFLKALQYVNVSFNALTSINGIEQCTELCQLFLANNRIRDIEPVASCQKLQVVSLFRNNVSSIDVALFTLRSLPELRKVDLEGNPCSKSPSYKHVMVTSLSLEDLDCEPVTPLDHELAKEFLAREPVAPVFDPRKRGMDTTPQMQLEAQIYSSRPSTAASSREASREGSRGAGGEAVPDRLFGCDFLNNHPILLEYMANDTATSSRGQEELPAAQPSSRKGSFVHKLRLTTADMNATSSMTPAKLADLNVASSLPSVSNDMDAAPANNPQQVIRKLLKVIEQLKQERDMAVEAEKRAMAALEQAPSVRSSVSFQPATASENGAGDSTTTSTTTETPVPITRREAEEVAKTAEMLVRENKQLRAENKNMFGMVEENKRLNSQGSGLQAMGSEFDEGEDALFAQLGVTARETAEVEKDVIAEASGYPGVAAQSSTLSEAVKEVGRIEQSVATVQHELEAVQAALDSLVSPTDEGAPSFDLDIRKAVGEERMAGLQAKLAGLEQDLENAQFEVAAAEASQRLNESQTPEPRREQAAAPLLEDDAFNDGLSMLGGSSVETERDRLIRTGMMTPFANLSGFERQVQGDLEQQQMDASVARAKEATRTLLENRGRTVLLEGAAVPKQLPNVREFSTPSLFASKKFMKDGGEAAAKNKMQEMRKKAKAKEAVERDEQAQDDLVETLDRHKQAWGARHDVRSAAEVSAARSSRQKASGPGGGASEAAGRPSDAAGCYVCKSETWGPQNLPAKQCARERGAIQRKRQRRRSSSSGELSTDDDFQPDRSDWEEDEEELVESSARTVPSARRDARGLDSTSSQGRQPGPRGRQRARDRTPSPDFLESDAAMEQAADDVVFDGDFHIQAEMYKRLFAYQQTGVKWLWELHCQNTGGIVGDEMGLGKTIQVAAFLGGLHYSNKFTNALVLCPATMLRQWRRELRTWYPQFQVVILHDSAVSEDSAASAGSRSGALRASLDNVLASSAGIAITTYEGFRTRQDMLLPVRWGYAILDEGHKIRNPDADVTLACKQLRTIHRIILTGAPIQNRLTELWSLFDFVFPGKLGTLPVFQANFSIPIQVGGYANASQLQVSTAYRCAVVLKDMVTPYLLRRLKADVNANLPKKTEQVLFCPLTREQRELYRSYIHSEDVEAILDGQRDVLAGIDILKKICNHPDLLERLQGAHMDDYGNVERSGKMLATSRVLDHWQQQGHRVLLFSQTKQMLDILEKLVCSKVREWVGREGQNVPRAERHRPVE